jgi:predicted aldo/keto reductase-like oxidoreductase
MDARKESPRFEMGRRQFVAGAAAVTAGVFSGAPAGAAGPVPTRLLGSTGERVSCIGMGGAHVGRLADRATAVRLVRSAVDRGITFMDNAWDYTMGRSEEWMGAALRDGYRDRVFLMTKVDGRDAATATAQLDESLKRLQTDHVDLWQFHEVIRSNDPERIFAPGGAFEAAMAAKKAGKIRFLGFTGHKAPAIHLEMLRVAADHGWTPDTVQMPVNVLDPHYDSFVRQVLPVLVERKIGVLAMKTFGDPYIFEAVTQAKASTPAEMLRYSLSLPTSTVITGIDKPEILDQAVLAATNFTPMSDAEQAALLERTRTIGETGEHQKMKTSFHFDSTHTTPAWLGPNGEMGYVPGQ